MGITTEFQKNKKENPDHGKVEKGNFQVLGVMPGGSKISQQKAAINFEKEIENDLVSLKLIKSKKEKESVKENTLVPKYTPFVDGLIASSTAHPFLGLFLVWLFDAGNFEKGLALAKFCLEFAIPLPEKIRRDIPTFITDVICDWAENQFDENLSASPYFEETFELVMDADLHDEVRAKMLRMHGLFALRNEEYETAVDSLTTAFEYGAKVKTKLAEAVRKLEIQEEEQKKDLQENLQAPESTPENLETEQEEQEKNSTEQTEQ
ncbi:MAG: phage terminase small subunit [Desulfotalea sp.]